MSAFLVTDTPTAVEPSHRVVVWLGKDHGAIAGKVTLHAKTPDDFLNVAIEHILPGLIEDFECAVSGSADATRPVAEFLLERYKYASRQAVFDLNTLRWTYKLCALQTIQKVARLPDRILTIDQLAGRHRDEACLIIGAGPSLDMDAIDPSRILTIATTRTARLCLQKGWCPDYIIHIDPAPFDGVLDDVMTHPLLERAQWLIPFQVHDKYSALPGRTFWFGSRLNPASLWISRQIKHETRLPLIISGGSVSCCAYTIAEYMGCSPLCLIGQDLSYQGSQKYQDAPSPDRFTSVSIEESDSLVLPGIRNEKVQTTMDYASYADWFVIQGRYSRRKLINCTARGVFLPGYEHIPLAKVHDRYCRSLKPAPTDTPQPHPFPRPDVRSALDRSGEVCRRLEETLKAGDYAGGFDILKRMARVDEDGFILTGCLEYESKILSYFFHLPPTHPKMKRCIDLFSAACRDARARIAAALTGDIRVPPVTESEVEHHQQVLREIAALE